MAIAPTISGAAPPAVESKETTQRDLTQKNNVYIYIYNMYIWLVVYLPL